jgi:hypothetical protein
MARGFNGTSDYIAIGSSPVGGATAGSASWWMYLTSLPSAYAGVITLIMTGGGIFRIYINPSNQLAAYINGFAQANVTGDSFSGSSTFIAGTWYHIALTLGSSTATLYINGASVGTQPTGSVSSQTLSSGDIGQDVSTGGRFFPGRLADMFLIDAALGAIEVSSLYRGVRPSSIRRTGAAWNWWPLDGLQSPEPDFSGNANNGTLTGTTGIFGPPLLPFTRRWPQFNPMVSAPIFTLMPQIVT